MPEYYQVVVPQRCTDTQALTAINKTTSFVRLCYKPYYDKASYEVFRFEGIEHGPLISVAILKRTLQSI